MTLSDTTCLVTRANYRLTIIVESEGLTLLLSETWKMSLDIIFVYVDYIL